MESKLVKFIIPNGELTDYEKSVLRASLSVSAALLWPSKPQDHTVDITEPNVSENLNHTVYHFDVYPSEEELNKVYEYLLSYHQFDSKFTPLPEVYIGVWNGKYAVIFQEEEDWDQPEDHYSLPIIVVEPPEEECDGISDWLNSTVTKNMNTANQQYFADELEDYLWALNNPLPEPESLLLYINMIYKCRRVCASLMP